MLNNAQVNLARQFNRKVSQVQELRFIYQEIAQRMIGKFEYLKFAPRTILDVGSGLGVDTLLLKEKFPAAQILQLDCAINILKSSQSTKQNLWTKLFAKNKQLICADANYLPLANNSLDLVWSNLVLPYITDMEHLFAEVMRVMALHGCFLFAGLGVDSLLQLRELGLNTYNFPDMHLIGDILVKLGFTNPVTDVEYIHLEYDSVAQLLTDIRAVGVGGATNKHYIGKEKYQTLTTADNSIADKKYKLTLEVFYAHAWKDKPVSKSADGASIIQFDYLDKKRR